MKSRFLKATQKMGYEYEYRYDGTLRRWDYKREYQLDSYDFIKCSKHSHKRSESYPQCVGEACYKYI